MVSKDKLLPKLRFKKFVETGAWQKYLLEELVEVNNGKDYKHLGKGEIPVYGTGGYMTKVNAALSYEKDAIGIGRKGTIDKPYILKAPYWTVDTLFYAIPKFDSNINFFQGIFKNINWLSKQESTGVPSLSKSTINNIEILIPTIQEQQQIGTFLKKIDEMIQLQQSKVNKVKNIKSAYLSEMFPKEGEKYPKRRFEGFIEPWEQVQVQDLFKITRGHVLSATKVTEYPTKKMRYPVYSSQTKNNGLMGYYHKYLYQNAITWTTDGANAGTVSYRPSKFYCTNVSGVLISNEGYANRMIAEALNQIAWKHVSKVGNPKLMNNIMAEITMTIPQSIKEQHKIAEFIRNLDNQISIEEEKLTKLEKLKQAYLNDMFV